MLPNLLFGILLTVTSTLFSQKHDWSLRAGFGIPDLIHLNVQKELSHINSIGISIGFLKLKEEFVKSYGIEHEFRFTKKESDLRSIWYINQRIHYLVDNLKTHRKKYGSLVVAFGEEFSTTDWWGFRLEAGGALFKEFNKMEKSLSSENDETEKSISIYPSFRGQIYVKF